jgi:hypothetical protein
MGEFPLEPRIYDGGRPCTCFDRQICDLTGRTLLVAAVSEPSRDELARMKNGDFEEVSFSAYLGALATWEGGGRLRSCNVDRRRSFAGRSRPVEARTCRAGGPPRRSVAPRAS